MSLKIATFNANSLRARLPIVLDWLNEQKPDLLGIQETKCQDVDFPLAAIEEAGWKVIFRGQKSYNGVAFVFKEGASLVSNRLLPDETEEEARFLHVRFAGIDVINTYVPQGFEIDSPKYQKKLKFFKDLQKYFAAHLSSKRPALWMGDLNVAPTEIDLARPKENQDHVCYHIDARNALAETMQGLWTDLFRLKNKEPGQYTFWDYRQPNSMDRGLGWRIDHLLGTEPLTGRLENIWVDKEPRRKEKPSDHTFLIGEFKS